MHALSFPTAVPQAEPIRCDHTRLRSSIHPKTARIVVSRFATGVLASPGWGWKIRHKTYILSQDCMAGSKTGSFVAADQIDNGRDTVQYGHCSKDCTH